MADTTDHHGSDVRPRLTKWWHWFLVYPGLVIAVVTAIVSFFDNRNSGRTFEERLGVQQQRYWEKNESCMRERDYWTVTTATNSEVGIILCDTGDVLIKISPADDSAYYRWVGADLVLQNDDSIDVGCEICPEVLPPPQPVAVLASLVYTDMPTLSTAQAQSGTVLCRYQEGGNVIVRYRRGGGCNEDVVDPTTGQVVATRSSSCGPCP